VEIEDVWYWKTSVLEPRAAIEYVHQKKDRERRRSPTVCTCPRCGTPIRKKDVEAYNQSHAEDPSSNSTSPTGSNHPDLASVDRLALIGQIYDDTEHVWGDDCYAHESMLMHLMVSIATVKHPALVDWTCDDPEEGGFEVLRQVKALFLEIYPDTHPVWKFITLREGPYPSPRRS
jgi:hypothetical protein